MSSNLFKMEFTTLQEGEKRVIDSNDLVARRIEALAEKMVRPENAGFMTDQDAVGEDGFLAGLNAERVEGLLSDEDESDGQSNVIKAGEDRKSQIAQAQTEAEQILAQAREAAEAERQELLAKAKEEIAGEREQALIRAKEQGYAEGWQKAETEYARKEKELLAREKAMEAEYEKLLEGMEIEMVDALTGVYEHLFEVELSSYRDVLLKLLAAALRKIDGSRNFLVHVSADDYPYVSMEKKQLIAALASPSASLELVEDITLKRNECMIETDNGIFDCGLGTQLGELSRKIKLLSYERA